MKKKYSQTEYVIKYVKAILKWIIASVLIGAACGLVGALFYSGVTRVTEIRAVYPWLLFLLPAAGLIITAMYMKFDIAVRAPILESQLLCDEYVSKKTRN